MTLQSVFHVAWLTGKVIVDVLTGISFTIFSVIRNIILFFQIVYEDNIPIFTEEIPSFADYVVDAIVNQWTQVQGGLTVVYNGINYKFSAIIGTVKWLANAVITIVCEVLILLKNTVILFGDTLWFILTFIPIQLPLLLRAFFKNLTDVTVKGIVDAYMGLLKITNFLTDVPLQSFIGIISAIVIVRLSIHFRESIQSQAVSLYWSVVRKLWYYYYAFYNYFVDPDVREITRMSAGQEISLIENQPQAAVVDDGSAADALCVVCQERQKCVLTLPCRHVCLCTECVMRLYGYQRTCPICRTFIYHSVTVYL
ncbi:zinc finger, c3HC4 type (RING finger) domain-containing protein [Phthorimaea operculella]|nr:zinc finger, c3HC4 type (RING finger) domain-containing protein [Phthorimaea operculella]